MVGLAVRLSKVSSDLAEDVRRFSSGMFGGGWIDECVGRCVGRCVRPLAPLPISPICITLTQPSPQIKERRHNFFQ